MRAEAALSARFPRAVISAMAVLAAAVADAHAMAPADQYALFDRANDVIHDQKTGLYWQRVPAASAMKQSDAAVYCAALVLDGAAGYRLPTYKELLTLVDEELWAVLENGVVDTKAIDLNAFPDTPSSYFWSSSQYAIAPSQGWVVDFTTGDGQALNASTMVGVRCVR
jgi:hypothetical protein